MMVVTKWEDYEFMMIFDENEKPVFYGNGVDWLIVDPEALENIWSNWP